MYGTHGLEFVLGRPGSEYDASKETKTTSIDCHECQFYAYVCDSINSMVTDEQYFPQGDADMAKDTIQVCNDCKSKMQMYMAHRTRCSNQNLSLEKTEEEMVKKMKESDGQHVQAIMITDFKIYYKLEEHMWTRMGRVNNFL